MYKKYKTVLVSGSTGSGKTTLLNKYIEYVLNNGEVELVLIDPKQVELFEHNGKEKVTYIAKDCLKNILEFLKPIIEKRINESTIKSIIIVDEFAELTSNKEVVKFFDWMFEHKETLNLELVLTSQKETSFTKKHVSLSDVLVKLK